MESDPEHMSISAGAADGTAATDVVIVGGARTPQGRLNGQLAPFTAVELGAFAVAGALEKSRVVNSFISLSGTCECAFFC